MNGRDGLTGSPVVRFFSTLGRLRVVHACSDARAVNGRVAC